MEKFEEEKPDLLFQFTLENVVPYKYYESCAEQLAETWTMDGETSFALESKLMDEIALIDEEIAGLNRLIICKTAKKGAMLKAIEVKVIKGPKKIYHSLQYVF